MKPRASPGWREVEGLAAGWLWFLIALLAVLSSRAQAGAAGDEAPLRPPPPVLTLASVRDLGTRVAGELDALPETPYQVLLLVVEDCPVGSLSSNVLLLDPFDTQTDAAGHASFSRVLDIPLNDSQKVVGRTLDGNGDTSEPSNCLPVEVELTYWEDAALQLTGSTAFASPGRAFAFTITLENLSATLAGRPAISNLTARFTLPPSVEFVAASEGAVRNETEVQFPGLTVPSEGALQVGVTVLPLEIGVVTATASVDDPGPYQANNRATISVEVSEPVVDLADLSLSKTASSDPVHAGAELEYILIVTNAGPDVARQVVLTDSLPASTRFLRATASQGHPEFAHGVLSCELGPMTNGAAARVTVVVQPSAEGSLTNVASVAVLSTDSEARQPGLQSRLPSSDGPRPVQDPDPDNNIAEAVTTVLRSLPLEPVDSPAFNPQTGLFEQAVRFTNVGLSPLSSLRLWLGKVAPGVLVLNASGTDQGRPYLHLGRPVAAAETVEFIVEFYQRDREPFPAPEYEAAEHPGGGADPAPDPGRPPLMLTGAMQESQYRIAWSALPARSYVVQAREYLPDPWRTASPAIRVESETGSWLEAGSSQTNAVPPAARFFRVVELP